MSLSYKNIFFLLLFNFTQIVIDVKVTTAILRELNRHTELNYWWWLQHWH